MSKEAEREIPGLKRRMGIKNHSGSFPVWIFLIFCLILIHGLAIYLIAVYEMKKPQEKRVSVSIQSVSMPHPDTADSLTADGRKFYREKSLDLALDSYNKAVEMDEKNRFAQTGRGIVLAEMGRLDEAERDFDRLKRENPDKPDGYFGSAIVEAKRENYGKALEEINHAIKFKPSEAQYLSDRGFILMNLKNYDKAKADFEKALKIDRNNPYTNMGLGEVFRNADELDKGAYYYEKAISLDPSIPKAQLFLASIYFDMDRFEESLEYYEAELEKIKKYGKIDDFQEAACYAEMARIYAMTDRMDMAKESLDNFYANVRIKDVFEGENERDLSLLSDLGNACIEMGAHDPAYYEKALQAYGTCLKFSDKYDADRNFYHSFQCGWCLWEMGKEAQAMRYFKQALNYRQKGKGRYNYWMPGHIYTLMGRYDEAIRYLNRSIEKDPDFENAYYSRALTYSLMKENDKAINDIDKVFELRKRGKAILLFNRKAEELRRSITGK
jgi:tetratricopeptide (TPR) repeat protein